MNIFDRLALEKEDDYWKTGPVYKEPKHPKSLGNLYGENPRHFLAGPNEAGAPKPIQFMNGAKAPYEQGPSKADQDKFNNAKEKSKAKQVRSQIFDLHGITESQINTDEDGVVTKKEVKTPSTIFDDEPFYSEARESARSSIAVAPTTLASQKSIFQGNTHMRELRQEEREKLKLDRENDLLTNEMVNLGILPEEERIVPIDLGKITAGIRQERAEERAVSNEVREIKAEIELIEKAIENEVITSEQGAKRLAELNEEMIKQKESLLEPSVIDEEAKKQEEELAKLFEDDGIDWANPDLTHVIKTLQEEDPSGKAIETINDFATWADTV